MLMKTIKWKNWQRQLYNIIILDMVQITSLKILKMTSIVVLLLRMKQNGELRLNFDMQGYVKIICFSKMATLLLQKISMMCNIIFEEASESHIWR